MEFQWKNNKAFEHSDCFNQICCEGINDAGVMAKIAEVAYETTEVEGADQFTLLEPEVICDAFFDLEDANKIIVATAIGHKQRYRDLFDNWKIEYEKRLRDMFVDVDSIDGNKQ